MDPNTSHSNSWLTPDVKSSELPEERLIAEVFERAAMELYFASTTKKEKYQR